MWTMTKNYKNMSCSLWKSDVLTGLEWAEIVLAADGERETMGLISWGNEPLATISWTLSLAFCRMLIACWCVIVWSSACPLIARIWSVSFNLPSLSRNEKEGKRYLTALKKRTGFLAHIFQVIFLISTLLKHFPTLLILKYIYALAPIDMSFSIWSTPNQPFPFSYPLKLYIRSWMFLSSTNKAKMHIFICCFEYINKI